MQYVSFIIIFGLCDHIFIVFDFYDFLYICMCVWEKIFYCLGFGLLIFWFCLEWFDGNCGLRLDLVRVGC